MDEGYFVQFAPGLKSQESDIMQDSNQLTPTQARSVLADILDHKILILETGAGPIRKRRRKDDGRIDDTPLAACTADNSTATSSDINTPIANDSNTDEASATAGDIPISDNPSLIDRAIAHNSNQTPI